MANIKSSLLCNSLKLYLKQSAFSSPALAFLPRRRRKSLCVMCYLSAGVANFSLLMAKKLFLAHTHRPIFVRCISSINWGKQVKKRYLHLLAAVSV